MKLAAYRCALDLGIYSQSKYKVDLFKNSMGLLVSSDLISNYRYKDLEGNIVNNWKLIT